MVESLSRLARHYDWLQANPNVLIHMRGFDFVLGNETSFQVRTARSIWQRVFSLLKIDMRRLITGPALARTVYFPRSAPCNLPLSNALEMRVLVHRMLALARATDHWGDSDLLGVGGLLQPRQSRTGHRPRLVLQHRQCSSSSPCQGWREMDARSFAMLQAALQDHLLPSSMHVMRFDEKDPPEQLRHEVVLYSKTDVVVGFHGAGLANLVFMRPGSLVIEIVSDFDGRYAPVCGYHGPLAAAFGIHHMLHYFDLPPQHTNNNSSLGVGVGVGGENLYLSLSERELKALFDDIASSAALAWTKMSEQHS